MDIWNGCRWWTNLGDLLTGPGTIDDPIAGGPSQFYRLFKP